MSFERRNYPQSRLVAYFHYTDKDWQLRQGMSKCYGEEKKQKEDCHTICNLWDQLTHFFLFSLKPMAYSSEAE